MARYARNDASERRTARLNIKLSPTEQAELRTSAARHGARPSAYARELLFRRSAAVVASTRRNPEAAALLPAITGLGEEISRVGNNLNQLARRANETGHITAEHALSGALSQWAQTEALVKQAIARVLDL
jgi:Bacterial mobilisation protein (MobC)